MVFSSSLFLFAFLPVLYFLDFISPGIRSKNFFLLIASLLFYSFGRLDWLLLLILSVAGNYIAGLFMSGTPKVKKTSLIISVIFNLGMLCIFKYTNFITEVIDSLPFISIPTTNISLPIGISFFTFQGMSYVIDAYRDSSLKSKSFTKVLLYIAFFPQLVAGPIVKYSDIEAQIDSREQSAYLTYRGICRFVVGLVKKLFFANVLGFVADKVYTMDSDNLSTLLVWLGVICYTLQIYYDFSAYSDMAIGLGKMFGFHINENFNHPYIASSIKDFWRRWHISLSSWFRDYLYIPLGGNRKGKIRARFNRLIVFFFTGLWHGANWTFIIWGLWHGMFLMIEDAFAKRGKLERKSLTSKIFGHIYTLLVVAVGFMLFRADSLSDAWSFFKLMFINISFSHESLVSFINLCTHDIVLTLFVGICFAMPIKERLLNILNKKGIKTENPAILAVVFAVFIICMLKLAASSFNPFIYTQF